VAWLMNWITKLNADGHVAIGVFVFVVGAAIHYFHGLDASFVAFTTTVFGFLGGHSWVQSQAQSKGSTPDASPDSK
jgi:hypothetical protein